MDIEIIYWPKNLNDLSEKANIEKIKKSITHRLKVVMEINNGKSIVLDLIGTTLLPK